MLPSYLASPFLRNGELIRLLPEARPLDLTLYAVYASRKHMPTPLRSLLDFLVDRFKAEPDWDKNL